MTSPAITKSPQNQKVEKKSPSHSAGGAESTPAAAVDAGATRPEVNPPQPADTFSWLRVFKLADLMVKQGC